MKRKWKAPLWGIIIGLSVFAIAARYGAMDVLGLLKVDNIQKLNSAVGVYVEDVIFNSGTIGTSGAPVNAYIDTLNVAGTFYQAGAEALCEGRLTLESGVAVSTTDQTAKTTLYFTKFKGDRIGLFDGTGWLRFTFTELSLDISGLTADTNYDIFLYDNSGTLTLYSVAWSNATTRATALTTQDGVDVLTGDTGKRYLGTIRITGSTGQCEDSESKRFVYNAYNRVWRKGKSENSNASWSYTNTANREYNNGTGQTRFQFVVGKLGECPIILSPAYNVSGNTGNVYLGVEMDATTSTTYGYAQYVSGGYVARFVRKDFINDAAGGYHYLTQIEGGNTGATIHGTNFPLTIDIEM